MGDITTLKYQVGVTDAALNPAALAIPATATTSDGASIDLGGAYSSGLNPRQSGLQLRIVIDAQTVTTLPNGQTIIVTLQDSANDSSFTALLTSVLTSTGASGTGALQNVIQFDVPQYAREFIRISVTTNGSGTGRDSTYATLSTRV